MNETLTSSDSFTFDQASQLYQDISTTLVTAREWINSFTPINRIPDDILSLIPTYLSSQNDRLRASFVCSRWRRVLLRRAELWTELFPRKGEDYLKAFLDRAKGSALDVSCDCVVPVSTMALLSPHSKQIRRLDLTCKALSDIRRFLEGNCGPLSFLHTLAIDVAVDGVSEDFDETFPSPSLFSDAVNLKVFHFHSFAGWSPSLSYFTFPNLVSFDLSTISQDDFLLPQLLDFLEASPALRMVHMRIDADMEISPSERAVVLPNVEKFTLIIPCYFETGIVAHISCPSARHTSLVVLTERTPVIVAFPTPVDLWNSIVHWNTKRLVEGVTLKIRAAPIIAWTLTLRSSNATTIELRNQFSASDTDEDIFDLLCVDEAISTIRSHPQLANIKSLRICDEFSFIDSTGASSVGDEAGKLFKSLGPLDELIIHHCSLRPYLLPLFTEDSAEEPVTFPPIKEFSFSHPADIFDEECTAVVEFAKSQHASGIPFERVIIRGECMPTGMEEALRPWVGSVEHYREELCEADRD